MDQVTPEQCKQVVRDEVISWLGHHRCFVCQQMVGYAFEWMNGNLVVAFVSSCGCSNEMNVEIRSWESFADEFNIQDPEVRKQMWERFRAGKPLHEFDTDSCPFIPLHNAADWQLLSTVITPDKRRIEWVLTMKSKDGGRWIKTIKQQRNLDGSVSYDESSICIPD